MKSQPSPPLITTVEAEEGWLFFICHQLILCKVRYHYDKLYEIKGVESLSDTWVILPQDVGITLAATVLNNGWIKCEQDTSHILVWLYYQ